MFTARRVRTCWSWGAEARMGSCVAGMGAVSAGMAGIGVADIGAATTGFSGSGGWGATGAGTAIWSCGRVDWDWGALLGISENSVKAMAVPAKPMSPL